MTEIESLKIGFAVLMAKLTGYPEAACATFINALHDELRTKGAWVAPQPLTDTEIEAVATETDVYVTVNMGGEILPFARALLAAQASKGGAT